MHNVGLTLKINHSVLTVAMSVLFLNLPGCGGVSDQPDLGLVTGTVTMDGAPLTGVQVTFQPDDGRPAIGTTNADGKYKLTYIRNTPGCKVGHNKVEIGVAEGEDENVAQSEGETTAPKMTKSGKPPIPARYNSKTELEADVKPGENTFDFDLKK